MKLDELSWLPLFFATIISWDIPTMQSLLLAYGTALNVIDTIRRYIEEQEQRVNLKEIMVTLMNLVKVVMNARKAVS